MSERTIEMNKSHVAFAAVHFVARAANDDDETRMAMFKRIHVEEGVMVATDGKRMHVYRGETGIGPGEYHIAALRKTKLTLESNDAPVAFPNWERVWEQGRKAATRQLLANSLTISGGADVGRVLAAYGRAQTGGMLNADYVADLVGFEWMIAVSEQEPQAQPVMFTSEGDHVEALLMPAVDDASYIPVEGTTAVAVSPALAASDEVEKEEAENELVIELREALAGVDLGDVEVEVS